MSPSHRPSLDRSNLLTGPDLVGSLLRRDLVPPVVFLILNGTPGVPEGLFGWVPGGRDDTSSSGGFGSVRDTGSWEPGDTKRKTGRDQPRSHWCSGRRTRTVREVGVDVDVDIDRGPQARREQQVRQPGE